MKRWRTWALAALLVVASIAAFYLEGEWQEFATADSVVIVELGESHGSGAHIGGGIILTAAHVVDRSGAITVRDRNGTKATATLLWANKAKDIALMKIDDDAAAKIPAASLFCGAVKEGDDVTVVGNPLGEEFVSGFGRIAGAARKAGKVESVYVTNVATVMGQSGGPLFHNGKIVGVVSMVMVAPMPFGPKDEKGNQAYAMSIVGYGYAVPSSVVCDLMGRSA